MRQNDKKRVPLWVVPVTLLAVAGSAVALLRTTAEPRSVRSFTQSQAGQPDRQARDARGKSAVLPAPQGWSPGQ